MTFTFDSNGNLMQSRVFLANPQKNYIGELNSVKEFKIKEVESNLNEASFLIYEYENGQRSEYFDDVLAKRLVEIQYMGWFEITKINPVQDENYPYEILKVTCLSLENKLVDKNIDDTNGVYGLYDVTDTEHSLLHIVSRLTNWKIGHIDNSLIGKKRTFSIDTNKIYNFLNTVASKSFDCIFVYDTYAKTINAYTLENYGELTDIVIHGRNILKGYDRVCEGADIVTKIKVLGGNGLDIRDVNPTATNYLININYFLDWLTVSTRNAYNAYQNALNGINDNYNTLRATLKTRLQELASLKAQLADLEGLKKSKEEVQGSYIQLYNGTPPVGSAEYTLYLAATNSIATYITQIANKKAEISAKEVQVTSIRTQLDNIGVNLSMNNYFTSAQWDELSDFLTEGDTYEDSSFIATDTMTDDEVLDIKIELMQNGDKELARASQPQFTTTISASNLFSMKDEPDSPISYSEWVNKLKVGNLITIKFRDDYWVTSRLVQIEIDFDNLEEIQLTFSNKNRFDDKTGQLGEMMANAERTASSLSMFKYGYDQASKQVDEVRELINGTFDATLNAMQSNDNQELYIDTYGLHMRKWLPNQNKYSDYQAWWNTNNLLFSSDGFKTVQTAIGLLVAPDGNSYYGIATGVLLGDLIMGSKLSIINSSGTYTINNNGITATSGIYSVGINPNTASEIINIKVNGVKKFYIDTANNRMYFEGHIVATSGTFSGSLSAVTGTLGNLTVVGTITGGTINGATITGGTISGGSMNINNRFIVDASGNLTATNANFSGRITGSTISGSTFTSTGNYAGVSTSTTINNGIIESNLINLIPLSGGGGITMNSSAISIRDSNNTTRFSVNGNGDITCVKINNATPVTSGVDGTLNTLLASATVGNATNASYAMSASYATTASSASYLSGTIYISANGNMVPNSSGVWCGTSGNPFAGGYATGTWATTSDERKKYNITDLDERFLRFAKMIVPYTYQMFDGTSGRYHTGFIAQRIEQAMIECGISDMEFAGLIKAPVYKVKLENGEYDTNSEIIDYDYYLRYSEFIPLLFLLYNERIRE